MWLLNGGKTASIRLNEPLLFLFLKFSLLVKFILSLDHFSVDFGGVDAITTHFVIYMAFQVKIFKQENYLANWIQV